MALVPVAARLLQLGQLLIDRVLPGEQVGDRLTTLPADWRLAPRFKGWMGAVPVSARLATPALT
jgi:hypothetical protein